jgi:hypothetical protein
MPRLGKAEEQLLEGARALMMKRESFGDLIKTYGYHGLLSLVPWAALAMLRRLPSIRSLV